MLLDIIIKTNRQFFRNKFRLALTFLIPVLLFSTVISFSSNSEDITVLLTIGILNEDDGYEEDYHNYLPERYQLSSNPRSLGDLFVDIMQNNPQILIEGFDSHETELRINTYRDIDPMQDDVETQSIDLGVVIPENFTRIVLAIYNSNYFLKNNSTVPGLPTIGGNTSVTTLGDPLLPNFQPALSFFSNAFTSFTNSIFGPEVFNPENTGEYNFVFIDEADDNLSEDNSPLSVILLIIFILTFNFMGVTSILAEEIEQKTTNRMMMGIMPYKYFFIAIFLNQILVGTIQFLFSVLIIEIVHDLPFLLWLKIFGIVQLFNFNVTALGLLIGSTGRNKKSSLIMSLMVVPILWNVSGVWVTGVGVDIEAILKIYIIEAWDFHILELFPTFVAVKIVKLMFAATNGGLIGRNVILLIIGTFVWFFMGLAAFNTRIMRSARVDRITSEIEGKYQKGRKKIRNTGKIIT